MLFIKKILRRFGYDIRYYRSFWDTVVLPHNIQVVLDIGANNGEYSREVFEHIPGVEVYAFEPLPDCYTTLTSAFVGNARFHSYPIALGETAGEVEMERSSFHPSSSLLVMAQLHKELYPKTAGATKEKVRVARLDEVMRDVIYSGNLMIKVDVQGFEDKVIRGGTETFKRATIVQIETSFAELYEGQPLFNDIYQMLIQLGFSYAGVASEHRNPKTQELLYQDSIFVKKH